MADRFYTDAPLGPGEFVLTGPDAHHLATVRRFSPGDRVTLFNGDGHEYPAEVLAVAKKQVVVTIVSRDAVSREPAAPIVVGAALPKGDRADYLIEKLTEAGGTRFVPLVTARSVVQPKADKAEKFTRQVIEASKQCGRNVLMRVDPPRSFADYLTLADLPPVRYILHTTGDERGSTAAVGPDELGQGVAFAIGPEGGFTPDEVQRAAGAGWTPLSFGPRVLRVETAVVVAAGWAAVRMEG